MLFIEKKLNKRLSLKIVRKYREWK